MAHQEYRVELISERLRLYPIWIKTKQIGEQFKEILTTAVQVKKEKRVEI
jgi:hypothetical protein